MDSTQITNAGAVVVVSGAGRRASLPVAAVADIAAARPALKLPFAADHFAGDAFEGAVPCGGALTAQLDLVRAWGGGAGEGATTLLVRTRRGPVRVRVERVSGPALPQTEAAQCGLADIEALLAGCLGRAPAPPLPPRGSGAGARGAGAAGRRPADRRAGRRGRGGGAGRSRLAAAARRLR